MIKSNSLNKIKLIKWETRMWFFFLLENWRLFNIEKLRWFMAFSIEELPSKILIKFWTESKFIKCFSFSQSEYVCIYIATCDKSWRNLNCRINCTFAPTQPLLLQGLLHSIWNEFKFYLEKEHNPHWKLHMN